MEVIIVHYGEIGIKGKNRPWFERMLVENIKEKLGKEIAVKRIFGRIIIFPEELTLQKKEEYASQLKQIFGISSFSFALSIKQDMDAIKEAVSALVKDEDKKTIRILTKRANKNFPLKSPDINKEVGNDIIKKYKKTIDYVDAELSVWIEIVDNYCFVYKEKQEGLNGLPVGVSGKVIGLLSGGIDSPVAAWYMMKRGCSVKMVHFFNDTINTQASLEKVKDLSKVLSQYNKNSKLYLIPFKKIQMEIIKKVPKEYRMIVYKRFMLRIGEKIARKEGAKAMVVGDSLGQVSSQILDNLGVIRQASGMIVFSPLIGFDKQEIVNAAQKIGTYDISIQPYGDCCSYMIAEHPILRPEMSKVELFEKNLDVDGMIIEAINGGEIIHDKLS